MTPTVKEEERKKEAFPKGPLVGCLLGLGTTAASYVEEPEYRMCSEYSVRGRVCVFDKRSRKACLEHLLKAFEKSIDSSTYS